MGRGRRRRTKGICWQDVFVDLKPPASGNSEWSKDATAKLVVPWKDYLLTGGNQVDFYPQNGNSMIVQSHFGQRDSNVILNFLLTQPEVAKVEVDSRVHYLKGVEPPPPPPKKKPSSSSDGKKKSKKKAKKGAKKIKRCLV